LISFHCFVDRAVDKSVQALAMSFCVENVDIQGTAPAIWDADKTGGERAKCPYI
jgi:hypothetical protein